MNVDMHFHTIPPFFVEELKSDNRWNITVKEQPDGSQVMQIGKLSIPVAPDHYLVPAILETMDRMRIDVAAISPAPILFQNHHDPGVLCELYRRVNEHMITLARSYPERFRPLGLVCLKSPEEALAELHRVMDAGLSGIEMETNIGGVNLDAEEFLPVYAAAEERGAVIFLHPLGVLGANRLRSFYLTNLIGNPTDTAVAVASLVFGGVMTRYPELKIVLPHGGGTTPCLCGRWDHGSVVRPELTHMHELPSELIRRFYFDTLTHSEAALSQLIEVVGVERIVLGSDHPYDMGDPELVARIERRTDLTEVERSAILGGNAARILSMEDA